MKNSLDQSLSKMDALLRQATALVAALSDTIASSSGAESHSEQPLESAYAKARKRHPNTGKPWSSDADQELRKVFESGNTIEDLSIYFQRTENGVRARLVKLGLLDATEFQPRFAA